MIEPHASETIPTSEAVLAEPRLAAVLAILAVIAGVTGRTIDAFGTPFARHAERETRAGDTLTGVPCVVDVLRIKDSKTVIAIPRLHGSIRIIAVVRTNLLEVVAGTFEKEPLKCVHKGFHRRTTLFSTIKYVNFR